MGETVDVSIPRVSPLIKNSPGMTHCECISVFRTVSQTSVDSDIATAFQRRFHISVDESEQNNVSKSRGTPLVVFI